MLTKSRGFYGRSACVAAMLLAMAVNSVRGAEPEVLKHVPADAYAVMVIGNVRTFANKLSNAATALEIPAPPDLVGFATRSMGIARGFDANSSTALVLLKPTPERMEEGLFAGTPPMVWLLPTSDAKAMLEPFEPTPADSKGISQVSLPTAPGEKGFVAVVEGKWVVLAQRRTDLVSYLDRQGSITKTLSPEALKIFETNDFVLWGNIEKLGSGADKWLDDQKTEMIGMMELMNLTSSPDAFASAMQRQGLGMVFSFAKQFLKDSNSTMLTARLTDSGATFGVVGEFKADSGIGKFVASQGKGEPLSLKGLPAAGNAGNFLAAGAMKWDSDTMSPALSSMLDQLLADPGIAKDPRAAEMKKAFELSKEMLHTMRGMRMVVLDPPAGGKDGFLNAAMIIDTTEPQKFLDLQIQSFRTGFAQESMSPDMKQTVSVTPDAITVKDVKLAKMTMKVTLRAETPEKPLNPGSREGYEIVQKMYGPEGMTAYMGVVGKRVLVVYGTDKASLEQAVDAAKEDADKLSALPMITGMKEQLVANPIMVSYLPMARWLTLAQSIMAPAAPGAPGPGPGITNAPPIVSSVGVSGQMMTAEIHVPIAAIVGIKEAYQRLERAMTGGAP